MKKVALCLHGLFDSQFDSTSKGIDGYEYIKKHILNRPDLNVDVYIHSWSIEQKDLIETLYKPRFALFEKQIDFSNLVNYELSQIKNYPRPFQNVISHFYSVSKSISFCNILYPENGYDIVIKSRFDLGRINRNTSGPGRHNSYPVQCINLNTNIESDKIYMADWNHFSMGPPDMWFYGSSEVMKLFSHLYIDYIDQLNTYSDFYLWQKQIENHNGNISNAVAFYKWWMIKQSLWDTRITLNTEWE